MRFHKLNFLDLSFGKIIKKFIKVSVAVASALMILTGTLGLFLTYMNPVPWIAGYFPLHMENILWTGAWVHITGEQVFQGVLSWQATPILSGAVSASAIFSGLALHAHNYKNWWRAIKASPRAIINAPIATYRKLKAGRDWTLAKVDYLNSESAKWRRTFQVMRSPYSFLRMMGFSPQMALGLIAVGGTAGTGVVVNETVFAE